MRKLLTIMSLLLCCSTASAVDAWSAINIMANIIKAGQWIADRDTGRRIYYIQVEGIGATEEAARQAGFRRAIAEAVGSIVTVETEVRNRQVVRDDILNYSSGYIDDYKVMATGTAPAGYSVKMEVWVGESKIANRILTVSRDNKTIAGQHIADQINSIQDTTRRGSQLIYSVARDIRRNGFEITLAPGVVTQQGGNFHLVFTADIKIANTFIVAMREVLDQVGTEASMWTDQSRPLFKLYGKTAPIVGWNKLYYLEDEHFKALESGLGGDYIFQIVLKNSSGQGQFYCWDLNRDMRNNMLNAYNRRGYLSGTRAYNYTFDILLTNQNKTALANTTDVVASITAKCDGR